MLAGHRGVVHRAVFDLPVEHEQLPFRPRIELVVSEQIELPLEYRAVPLEYFGERELR